MTPTLCRLAPALAAALLSARAAHAAAPWEGPPLSADPAAIRAAADALASPRGAPLDVLLEEGVFRIDARGAVAQTYRVVYRPMSAEAARASARVERAWAPWREERPEIRARVVGADGAVATLEPGALAEAPVADGTGTPTQRRELSGIIPGVRSGAVVEQITAVRESAPPVAGAEVHRFRVGSPARLVRLTIEAPAGTALRWIVRGAELTPVETVAGGVRTLVFERRDAAPIPPREPFAPRELAPAPYVAFAAGQSWADVAGRVRAVFEGAIAGADLRAEVRAALGTGRPGREEKVRRIAAWLRGRVRATGVGIDEAPLAPTPPADVLARGAGDAKDLAALLTALLRAAGLEADVALAASEWHDPPREVPGLGQLDHALVRVGGKGAPIWIDPSAAQLAPGTLPLDAQGKLALVAARRTRDLVRTPASGPADNAALTVRELHLAGLGRGRVVETRELGGLLAASERELRARVPLDHRDRLDERYAREALRADVFLGADVRGLEDPAAPFRVRVEAEGSALAETGDDEALVPVGAAPVLEPLSALLGGEREGAAPAPRRDDLELALPYRWEIRYRIFPPDGFRARRLPEGAVERFGPATLTRRYAAGEDGSVTASYLLDTGGRRLAAAEADALAARVRAAAGGEPDRIAFERTAAALLEDGQVKEALAELRRLSAAHPREAMHPLHLALSLLELGDQEGAAAEARRAIGLEPGRAWGHRVLGWILEHDAVGRRFGHGFDRAGAIAAYRRAAELDPGHAGGRAALAELLSRNGAGVRFGPGADLDAALAEYAALRADAGPGPHDTGLLATLLAAGHHADAAAIAREVAPSPERNAAMLAAAAVLGGAHRAQAEAEALGDDGGAGAPPGGGAARPRATPPARRGVAPGGGARRTRRGRPHRVRGAARLDAPVEGGRGGRRRGRAPREVPRRGCGRLPRAGTRCRAAPLVARRRARARGAPRRPPAAARRRGARAARGGRHVRPAPRRRAVRPRALPRRRSRHRPARAAPLRLRAGRARHGALPRAGRRRAPAPSERRGVADPRGRGAARRRRGRRRRSRSLARLGARGRPRLGRRRRARRPASSRQSPRPARRSTSRTPGSPPPRSPRSSTGAPRWWTSSPRPAQPAIPRRAVPSSSRSRRRTAAAIARKRRSRPPTRCSPRIPPRGRRS